MTDKIKPSYSLRKSIRYFLVAAFVSIALPTLPSAHAAVLASTSFDGQTITGATASDLNWTLNGLQNPGNMTALTALGGNQNLFNSTTLTQNAFAPLLNTGNGNTFWTTNVFLTVSTGMTVSLENVSFGYWAVTGGGAQNADRRSDFTARLYNPSDVLVDSVSINDVVNGTVVSNGSATSVSLTFASAIALSAPGTYRLEIQGGDYAGTNETGNHTGIDNLSINGTAVIPEPATALLGGLGVLLLLRH